MEGLLGMLSLNVEYFQHCRYGVELLMIQNYMLRQE
jgi:hypothetical protein